MGNHENREPFGENNENWNPKNIFLLQKNILFQISTSGSRVTKETMSDLCYTSGPKRYSSEKDELWMQLKPSLLVLDSWFSVWSDQQFNHIINQHLQHNIMSFALKKLSTVMYSGKPKSIWPWPLNHYKNNKDPEGLSTYEDKRPLSIPWLTQCIIIKNKHSKIFVIKLV